ncbi:hypothetical protein GCM10008106_03300 [Mongoliitalea lutea]|uniref:Uncharacterized protein n=1 Tax=Mongoliitalea lutea TaxID=849756 RepID=A0A8J3G410_9BACT|nr:hypothetical protein GCM10008106_03300 [Mongoliitalea lutea]
MSKKYIPICFNDRNLPINPMSKERMNDLEKKFAPFVEEIKEKLKKDSSEKVKLTSTLKS